MLDKEQILWFCKEKESPKHKKKRPDGRSLMTRKVICPSLSCSPVEQEFLLSPQLRRTWLRREPHDCA